MISRERLEQEFRHTLNAIYEDNERFDKDLKKIVALINVISTQAQAAATVEEYDKLNAPEFKSTNASSNISNILNSKDVAGDTLLMHASKCDRLEVVQALIKAKANIDAQNNAGETALILTANYSEDSGPDILQALIEAKAEPNIQCKRGYTALYHAAKKADTKLVEILIKADANPNLTSRDGQSPLIMAVVFYCSDLTEAMQTIRLLLKAKAEVNQIMLRNKKWNMDDKPMTALDWAILHLEDIIEDRLKHACNYNPDIFLNRIQQIDLLLTHGSKISDPARLLKALENATTTTMDEKSHYLLLACTEKLNGILLKKQIETAALAQGCSSLLTLLNPPAPSLSLGGPEVLSSSLSTSATILSSLPLPSISSPVVVATDEKPSAPQTHFTAKRKASSELSAKPDTESGTAQATISSRLQH